MLAAFVSRPHDAEEVAVQCDALCSSLAGEITVRLTRWAKAEPFRLKQSLSKARFRSYRQGLHVSTRAGTRAGDCLDAPDGARIIVADFATRTGAAFCCGQRGPGHTRLDRYTLVGGSLDCLGRRYSFVVYLDLCCRLSGDSRIHVNAMHLALPG